MVEIARLSRGHRGRVPLVVGIKFSGLFNWKRVQINLTLLTMYHVYCFYLPMSKSPGTVVADTEIGFTTTYAIRAYHH